MPFRSSSSFRSSTGRPTFSKGVLSKPGWFTPKAKLYTGSNKSTTVINNTTVHHGYSSWLPWYHPVVVAPVVVPSPVYGAPVVQQPVVTPVYDSGFSFGDFLGLCIVLALVSALGFWIFKRLV